MFNSDLSYLHTKQVVVELIECRELDLAREMLRAAPPLRALRAADPERFMGLDHLSQRPQFDAAAAYGAEGVAAAAAAAGGASVAKAGKERRRGALAEAILPHVSVVAPSRMLALVGQALKWQQHNGLLPRTGQFDLFKGTQRSGRSAMDAEERGVKKLGGSVRFGSGCHAEAAAFSPDGVCLVTGSSDGFLEAGFNLTCA